MRRMALETSVLEASGLGIFPALEQCHVVASRAQFQRGCHSEDSAADNCDVHRFHYHVQPFVAVDISHGTLTTLHTTDERHVMLEGVSIPVRWRWKAIVHFARYVRKVIHEIRIGT